MRADIETAFLAAVDLVLPQLGERVRDGRREERFAGATQLPNFVRRSHGPGGRWSATPAVTRTPCWRSASATPCATPACSARQDDIDAFYAARQGLAPRTSFVNDVNLARVMAAGAA